MQNIIDSLIDNDERETTAGTQCIFKDTEDTDDSYIFADDIQQNVPVTSEINNADSDMVYMSATPRDFHYPNKNVGYLAQSDETFSFVGPDRQPIRLNSIDQLIQVANLIRDSGLPNFKAVRIPIESDLNVKAWDRHLCEYADKRILQYIKFGFPLSLHNPQELNNTKVSNHFSACQYPCQVQEYIDKEIKLGALLGPVKEMDHEQFHCSPLLTRPKDFDKRRVILNLSHPHGNSVNSHVDKALFDGSPFILKFPTVDDIASDIIECTDDPVLFKVDVVRSGI